MESSRGLWDLISETSFIELDDIVTWKIYVKLEGYNPAGSIKLKTALSLLEDAERRHRITPDSILIESSSGNLGVALAIIAAQRGYRFVCVLDPNASAESVALIKAFGADVVVVSKKDANGGYLNTRVQYIQEKLKQDDRYVWLNQYCNPANPAVHERTTAPALLAHLPKINYLFIGAGTTGTLMGCARHFRRHSRSTKIIAVDSAGSVTFGAPPATRRIPGLGTSRRPEICDPSLVDDVVFVPEAETIKMCRWLAHTRGLLLGGSTGTVLAGIRGCGSRLRVGSVIATISPDNGDRYLKTVYNDAWVKEFYPEALGESFRVAA